MTDLTLISHDLCPYVQRAAIVLTEKQVPFVRRDIDLANKPDWFVDLSPLGKTPVLKVGDKAVFESAVIVEFLEDTQPNALHPRDPLDRARHRGWVEFASAFLNDIGRFYSAKSEEDFEAARLTLAQKVQRLEGELTTGPWFAGAKFSLVDAAFGPAFRYFDRFDQIGDFGVFDNAPKTRAWRRALADRPSVRDAVVGDYDRRLAEFITRRGSYLTKLQANAHR